MSDVRDWRRGGDWGRPYEDDPYWDRRRESEDRRRESRDMYGDESYGDRRGWGRDVYGRSGGGRDDWQRSQARGYERESDPRDSRDWARRGGARADARPDQGYGPRDPGRDPSMAGRRAISGAAPGGPWPYEESWGRAAEPEWRRGYQPGGAYGRGEYDRAPYGDRDTYGRSSERSWWDRASDEVSSWFGDDRAEGRREHDEKRSAGAYFRGHGPRGYTRSDERIREDVSDRLTDNPVLDATDIEVEVRDGEVTLHGHVDSRYSKRLAEDLTDEVSGVKHVQNNLRIRDAVRQRESLSGTYSGADEGGRTSQTGRTAQSGVSGSSGTGNTAAAVTGGLAGSGETTSGAKADRAPGSR